MTQAAILVLYGIGLLLAAFTACGPRVLLFVRDLRLRWKVRRIHKLSPFAFYWRSGIVRFPVWSPQSPPSWRWPLYQERIDKAPDVFMLYLYRGIRHVLKRPSLGRAVSLDDMLLLHPPGRAVCKHCRGSGIDRSGKGGKPAARFCPTMAAAFGNARAPWVRNTRKGPHWIAGFEPERIVR